jgi:hypothetical protein
LGRSGSGCSTFSYGCGWESEAAIETATNPVHLRSEQRPCIALENQPANSTGSFVARSPFSLDLEEFRHLLSDFYLNDQKKDELLGCLWNVMYTFASLGFDKESNQFVISDDDNCTITNRQLTILRILMVR